MTAAQGLVTATWQRSALPWLLAGAYFVSNALGHLEFSLWLVRTRPVREAFPILVLAVGAGLAAWCVAQARRSPGTRLSVAGYWIAWLACVLLVDRFLTYSVYEYAHYPQYALLAILLGLALDPLRTRWCTGRILFWTTLLGMVDELQQYLWIAPQYGHYLDFNDFLVNLLAAGAGVMLYYGFGPAPAQRANGLGKPEAFVALGVAVCVVLMWLVGWLAFAPAPGTSVPPGGWSPESGAWFLQRASTWYGSWREGPHRGTYLVLPPWPALALMLAAGLFFGRYAPQRAAP
jgi:hypothetical protein